METLLSCYLHDPAQESQIYIPRFTHRLSLIKAWEIPPGQHILDIGCGQGESSLALAMTLGPSSHITGIDDGPPDYGTPFALRESQLYIENSALGPRITFIHTDAPSLLPQLQDTRPPNPAHDAAVLCHSLWYFPSRAHVASLFLTLAAARIPLLYIAEYTYEPSDSSQQAHIHAARAQTLLSSLKTARADAHDDLRASNVRAAMDQAAILEAAAEAGFSARRRGTVTPEANMLEGHFEARHVKGDRFLKVVRDEGLPREQEGEILGLVARVREEMEGLEKRGVSTVRAMDSWWAVLELNSAT